MAFFKALIPAALLTWVVSIVLGSNGSKGGFLYIKLIHLTGGAFGDGGHSFYWSWPLLVASLGLCFAVIKMLE